MNQTWTIGMKLSDIEKDIIMAAMKYFQGNKSATAASLGVSVRTISNKIQGYERQLEKLLERKAQREKDAMIFRNNQRLELSNLQRTQERSSGPQDQGRFHSEPNAEISEE